MAEPYRLVVKRHGLILDEREVDRPQLSVGRDPAADLVLDDPSLSRRMALFELSGSALKVSDPGSLEGMRVNGRPAVEADIQRGDAVELGPFVLEVEGGPEPVARPPEVEPEGEPEEPSERSRSTGTRDTQPSGNRRRHAVGVVQKLEDSGPGKLVRLDLPGSGRLDLGAGTHAIGRDPASRVALLAGAVSKHHAELEVTDATILVRDLGSTNGTFVNGSRVKEQAVHDGDTLRFGDVEVKVRALVDSLMVPPEPESKPSADGATIVTVGPTGGSERESTHQTVLTGAALLEQSQRIGDDGEVATTGKPSRLRLLLIVLLAVVVGVLGLLILSSPPEEAVVDVVPAPAPAPAAPAEPVVDAAALYERGRVALREDRIEEAASLWQRAIEADPRVPGLVQDYGELLFRIGYVYEGDGRYDAARQTWERLVEVLADFPEDHNVIHARVHLRQLEAPR